LVWRSRGTHRGHTQGKPQRDPPDRTGCFRHCNGAMCVNQLCHAGQGL
jgi:hypothetical protein